mmetsp:Transcript_26748/g.79026  ORF Transcript_26748/g.79026 Transcript_26748/m.79026 type:complete len:90 (+) Transcript_26748:30-299(+)
MLQNPSCNFVPSSSPLTLYYSGALEGELFLCRDSSTSPNAETMINAAPVASSVACVIMGLNSLQTAHPKVLAALHPMTVDWDHRFRGDT